MKNILIVFILALIFLGCDEDPYYYHTVSNDSTKNVTVNFHGVDGTVSLAPGVSKEIAFKKKANEYGIINYSPDKRVSASYNKQAGKCVFKDRKAYEIRILNLSGVTGTLSAEGWMEEINFTNINTEQQNSSWVLYNDKPNFTALSDNGYSLLVLFLKEIDIIKVTIMN